MFHSARYRQTGSGRHLNFLFPPRQLTSKAAPLVSAGHQHLHVQTVQSSSPWGVNLICSRRTETSGQRQEVNSGWNRCQGILQLMHSYLISRCHCSRGQSLMEGTCQEGIERKNPRQPTNQKQELALLCPVLARRAGMERVYELLVRRL